MRSDLLQLFTEAKIKQQKLFALLVDPDKQDNQTLQQTIDIAVKAKADVLFVGGSLLTTDVLDDCMTTIKSNCNIPTILFPGSVMQINDKADALFFLSLISGRNPEMLIGQHVIAAPYLKQSKLQVLPTGYILIDGGTHTTVSYISNTTPIPANKPDIAACTAIAGEMLGLKLLYMDAGSGAKNAISEAIIKAVSEQTNIPLIVGGGILTPEKAAANCRAGADVIVVGNAAEKNPSLILEMAKAIHQTSSFVSA
jgi:putative glycerol-1-phosphate prenyltransferase